MAGAYLVDQYRSRGIVWLYPKNLRLWITQIGLRNLCRDNDGVDDKAANILAVLLEVLHVLPIGPSLVDQLRPLDS